jgi:hypothetical protein
VIGLPAESFNPLDVLWEVRQSCARTKLGLKKQITNTTGVRRIPLLTYHRRARFEVAKPPIVMATPRIGSSVGC